MDRSCNKVLIFSAQASRLEATVSFLKRRGWQVSQVHGLREALSEIVTVQPNFVFTSIHLTDTQIRTIKALCDKYQNMEHIAFSETSTMEAVHRLANCGVDNILYPPVGGPAFDRCLKRFILETKAPRINTKTTDEKDTDSEEIYWPYGSNPRIPNLQRSVLYRAIQRAVEQVSEPRANGPEKSLSVVKKLSYFEIVSRNYCGYLVVASPEDSTSDIEVAEAVQGVLNEALEAAGDRIEDREAQQISVEEVDFKEWARRYAAYHKTFNHRGEEIGIAFFALEESWKDAPANEYHLVPVDLGRVDAHRVIHFDLYLHLPLNGRFIRYVQRGEKMAQKQKQNLLDRSIDKIYVRKRDLPQWRSHLAKQFFDENIASFNNQLQAAA